MAVLVPSRFQAFDASGNFLVGGKLYWYAAGTTTPQDTYTDAGGLTPNTNPVILDARGEASIWLDAAKSYKRVLKTSLDSTIYSEDNIQGPNAATITFTPAGTGAVTSTVQAKLREHRSVLDFGAVGDGVNDDTAEIQAGIDAVESAGGGTLWFPKGTYKVSATLLVDSNNVNLVGDGWNTVITRSGDYGNTIKFSGNDATGVSLDYCGLSNMRFVSTGLMNSGAHVWLNGVFLFTGANVHCTDGFHTFRLSGARRCYLDNWEGVYADLHGGTATGRKGWLFDAAAATYGHPSCAAVFIDGFNIQGPSSATGLYDYGMYATCADGIWPSNGHLGAAAVANVCLSAEDATQQLGIFKVVNLEIDSICTGSAAIQCKGSANDIFMTKFTNLDLHGGASGYYGLLVDAGTNLDGLEIATCTTFNFDRDGMRLLGGRNYRFTGWNSRGNSRETVNTYSGIYMENVAGAVFNGGGSGKDPLGSNETTTQKYGIEFGSGNADIVLDGGMDLQGNLSGSIGGGAGQYRTGEILLDKTPSAKVLSNLVDVGGLNFNGTTTYLDGTALTGAADSKKLTIAAKFRHGLASGVAETFLHRTGSAVIMIRAANGSFQIAMENTTGTTVLNQVYSAGLASAGTYTLLFSVDMDNASSVRIYLNDATTTITSTTFTVGETLDLTPVEWSIGATAAGASFLNGDFYCIGVCGGVYFDFATVANRRKFFDRGGNKVDWGKDGSSAFGAVPFLYLGGAGFDAWDTNRGSGTGAFVRNGALATPATVDYGYNEGLVTEFTCTAATFTLGNTIQYLIGNRAGGTITVTLPDPTAAAQLNREVTLRTVQNQTMVSASSNVVPLTGGAAGTAIVAGTSGKWARLRANGMAWQIIEGN